MLDVSVTNKSFRTANGGLLKAIERIEFQVPDGEFACLVGPSGCGKTTTLRLILGLDRAFEGRIETPPGRVAAMFQEPRLLPWRTIDENVRLSLPPGITGEALLPLFDTLGLADMGRLYPGELSMGMARRAALARAFAIEPALLVLDEPFVSLDEATAVRMRALLMEVWRARRTTALMVTHNITEAVELADRIVVLSERPATVLGVETIDVPRERRDPETVRAIVDGIAKKWPVPD